MEAIWIGPEDIGTSGEWSEKWINFCLKLGYTADNIPKRLLLVDIKTPY